MEEQILKIVKKNFVPLGEMDDDEACAKEITTHVMEFIEWLIMSNHVFSLIQHETELFYENWLTQDDHDYTLEEVYQYWINT